MLCKSPMLLAVACLSAAVISHPASLRAEQTYAPGRGEPTLDEVRRATERFRSVDVALAEGYIRDPFDLCDTAEMMGRPASLGAPWAFTTSGWTSSA